MPTPRVIWDQGTAYDLFISLLVLHKPAKFSLRAAWAAGMRSRLPSDDREFLEMLSKAQCLYPPLHWLHQLPGPKDGVTLLRSIENVPPAERLPRILTSPEEQYKIPVAYETLISVAERGTWEAIDQERITASLQEDFKKIGQPCPTEILEAVPIWLTLWSQASETGEKFLEAMQSYYDVFFAEEERRIAPALEQAIARAQELARKMDVPSLLEELSQGVQFTSELEEVSEIILAPSYWSTPLILYEKLAPQRMLITFGARPADASLVPGDTVPDSLMRVLKALSDSTRMRILRYLEEEPQTPSQLARRLRLRPPTVNHHLTELRMAGLVHIQHPEGKEKVYSARAKAIEAACNTLQGFLRHDQ
jgi:DNA-binding transcriptional ArsR family regulator